MTTRVKTRTKKKRKKWLIVVLSLLILIMIPFTYIAYQYEQGKSIAASDQQAKKDIVFNGEKGLDGKINVLLLGIDTRGEEHSRTDTIMIAQYDPDSHQPKIVSLMRDIYSPIPGHQSYKINTAYFLGGPELLRKTIKEDFGINIQYYAIVDFKGFEKATNTLFPNGIKVDVGKKMSYGIGQTIQAGEQDLNGKQLLGYVRFRHDSESDFGRVGRQQEILGKLMDKLTSFGGITQVPKLVGEIQPYIDTNLDSKTLLSLGASLFTGNQKPIKSLSLPIKGSYENKRFPNDVGLALDINFEKNRKALKAFLNGKPS